MWRTLARARARRAGRGSVEARPNVDSAGGAEGVAEGAEGGWAKD